MSMSRLTAFATKAGTVHLTTRTIAPSTASKTLATALGNALGFCGRRLAMEAIYSEQSIPKLAEEHRRLSLTHETGLCRICFDKLAETQKD